MSSVGSTQGASGLFQFLQGLSPAGSSSSTSAGSNASGGAATLANALNSSTSAAGGHHHKHGGGFEKLASAVTSALQSLTSGSSASDANQTITDALTKIFKNGSLSPTGETDPTSATAAGSTSQTPDADGDKASTSGLPDSFVNTLKSFGVTPQQFQADLANAIKAAQQTGSVDLSAVFKSFPTGSAVDAVG